MYGQVLGAVVLLCVTLLDTTPATATHDSQVAADWTGGVRRPGAGTEQRGGRQLLSKDNGDGVNRAGEELEKIIHQRDLAMQARESYVKRKMHGTVALIPCFGR